MSQAQLRELYQETIIDHNKHPRNHYAMAQATNQAQGFNPLCGDKITLYLQIKKNRLEKVSFVGVGCAISQASASMLTEILAGKTTDEAHTIFANFHTMMVGSEEHTLQSLDKLSILSGVKAYPARVKCATLAWHTLEAALSKSDAIVNTEEENMVEDLQARIITQLKTVYDPEIPVNIYDLGLIYDVIINEDNYVDIKMTLTTPGCPVAQTFPGTVEEAVNKVAGVTGCSVELVWEPPWSKERMTEAARLELGIFY